MTETAAPREPRTWDIVATIVELIVLCLAGLLASFAGLFLIMASDSCGTAGTDCSTGLLLFGVVVAVFAPWLALLPMGVWAIVRMVRSRSSWWIPLLAMPIAALVYAVGVAIVFSSVG